MPTELTYKSALQHPTNVLTAFTSDAALIHNAQKHLRMLPVDGYWAFIAFEVGICVRVTQVPVKPYGSYTPIDRSVMSEDIKRAIQLLEFIPEVKPIKDKGFITNLFHPASKAKYQAWKNAPLPSSDKKDYEAAMAKEAGWTPLPVFHGLPSHGKSNIVNLAMYDADILNVLADGKSATEMQADIELGPKQHDEVKASFIDPKQDFFVKAETAPPKKTQTGGPKPHAWPDMPWIKKAGGKDDGTYVIPGDMITEMKFPSKAEIDQAGGATWVDLKIKNPDVQIRVIGWFDCGNVVNGVCSVGLKAAKSHVLHVAGELKSVATHMVQETLSGDGKVVKADASVAKAKEAIDAFGHAASTASHAADAMALAFAKAPLAKKPKPVKKAVGLLEALDALVHSTQTPKEMIQIVGDNFALQMPTSKMSIETNTGGASKIALDFGGDDEVELQAPGAAAIIFLTLPKGSGLTPGMSVKIQVCGSDEPAMVISAKAPAYVQQHSDFTTTYEIDQSQLLASTKVKAVADKIVADLDKQLIEQMVGMGKTMDAGKKVGFDLETDNYKIPYFDMGMKVQHPKGIVQYGMDLGTEETTMPKPLVPVGGAAYTSADIKNVAPVNTGAISTNSKQSELPELSRFVGHVGGKVRGTSEGSVYTVAVLHGFHNAQMATRLLDNELSMRVEVPAGTYFEPALIDRLNGSGMFSVKNTAGKKYASCHLEVTNKMQASMLYAAAVAVLQMGAPASFKSLPISEI